MTVKELIEWLSDMDQESVVMVYVDPSVVDEEDYEDRGVELDAITHSGKNKTTTLIGA